MTRTKARAAKSPKGVDPQDVEVGRRIRSQRLVRGLSQTELGERVGVTFQQVQKYEKGTNRVSASRLQKIAEVLGVPISFFFSGGSSPSPSGTSAGLEFLETAGAVRLVRAYSRIEDPALRSSLVGLAEAIVINTGKSSRSD